MTDIAIRQGETIDILLPSQKEVINMEVQSFDSPLTIDIDEKKGVSDYSHLTGKPTINTITVEGNKTGPDYRLQNKMDILSVQEIEKILYLD